MSSFIPDGFRIDSAESLVDIYTKLLDRRIDSVTELENWLVDASALESHVSEDLAWRYIRMTCDTKNKENESSYLKFVQEIQPVLAPLEDQLNKKIKKRIRNGNAVREPSFRAPHPYLIYPSDAERNGSSEPVARAVKFLRFLAATRYSYGVAIHTHTALSSSSFEIAV